MNPRLRLLYHHPDIRASHPASTEPSIRLLPYQRSSYLCAPIIIFPMPNEFYQLTANNPQGRSIDMSAYKGKVVLVVNTATQCGLTPQFEGLEKLYQDYKDKGLIVLGFPCNQFGSQEPLSNETMEATCKINHGVTFPLFEKIEVNGPHTHPVFKYL